MAHTLASSLRSYGSRVWQWILWSDLRDPAIVSSLDALRQDLLRQLIVSTAILYLLWHFGAPLIDTKLSGSLKALEHSWILLIFVALTTGGSVWLIHHRPALASWYFVLCSSWTIQLAIVLERTSWLLLLAITVIFTAVLLLSPLAGILCAAVQLALFLTARSNGWLSPPIASDLPVLIWGMPAAILLGASFGHALVVAVTWSTLSFEKASHSAQEAQRHRGELVKALQQLDDAYYRLRQANAALEMAWKAADAAERSKSEFVTNISHELRTPLNLIAGFSEMMVTSPESYGVPLPAEYRGDLHAIYRSAQHLLNLTEDVLDLARIGAGHLTLVREPLSLHQVIEEARAVIREYVESKGLFLRIDVREIPEPLLFDRLRIRQVLLNLLTNAARFTTQGGITVRAQPRHEDVIVEVSDTGPGIAPPDIPHVFAEFRRGEQTTSAREHRGYGLGLSISKRLIELHGGQIGVESTEGVGTTFWFTLPQAAMLPSYAPTPRPTDLSWLAHSGERVLILYQEKERTAHFLQRHLHGFRVIHARHSHEAITLATTLHALAFLIPIPQEVPHEIAALNIPVIQLPLPHTGQLAEYMGVFAYLLKPLRRSELLEALARLPEPPQRLLLIDDDVHFVRLLRRYLRDTPWNGSPTVVAAHSLSEAQLMLSEPFDLILLDLLLPDGIGTELLTQLRQNDQLKNRPVIIISAHEGIREDLPLKGILSLSRATGIRLEELLRLLEAILAAVDPPERYLRERSAESLMTEETRGRGE